MRPALHLASALRLASGRRLASGFYLTSGLCLASPLCLCAQDLPVKGAPGNVEREAAQLIEGLPDLTEPKPGASPTANLTVAQAEARLTAARRKQERWERLQKQGVISRVEAENSALEVFQAAYRCELARRTEAGTALAALRQASANPEEIARAETAEKEAQQHVLASQTAWNTASLKAAKTNLERFRRLYADRLVSKSQVQRLESTITILEKQEPKDPLAPLPPTPPPPPVRPFR